VILIVEEIMAKHAIRVAVLCGFLASLSAQAQIVNNCPYSTHAHSLACLIPDVTGTGGSSLAGFNTTIGQVVGQLPLAVPVSGYVLGIDTKTGVPVNINDNLGSVLTERGNTVGKHHLFLGFTFQRFVFQSVDGTNLNNLPTVYAVSGSSDFGNTKGGISANVNQYTAIAAFGLTGRIDLSVTLPFERMSISGTRTSQQLYTSSGGLSGPPTSGSLSGSASGVGDLLLNMKGTVIDRERSKLAMGLEARFPTGDAYNLLGSGAYGVKPYVVFSRHSGKYTPHVNLGYQWNGFSVLRVNPCYYTNATCGFRQQGQPQLPPSTLRLPDSLDYSAGVDIGVVKTLSFVADLVGQRFFNAPRVTPAAPAGELNPPIPGLPISLGNLATVGLVNSSYNVDNLGLGLKWNPAGHLILSANALIRLDSGGLRPARVVPLAGISYRF
jgi:hypothetical protein